MKGSFVSLRTRRKKYGLCLENVLTVKRAEQIIQRQKNEAVVDETFDDNTALVSGTTNGYDSD